MTEPTTSAASPGSRAGSGHGTGSRPDSGIATGQTVSVVLPSVLAALAGDRKLLQLPVEGTTSVAAVLDVLGRDNPVLDRRIRDETGAVRRYVNLFVDGEDVRSMDGASTGIRPGQELFIIQSVAGG